MRYPAEVKKKIKRRLKKEKERKLKEMESGGGGGGGEGDIDTTETDTETGSSGSPLSLSLVPLLGDLIEQCAMCKSGHKMKSIAVSPLKEKDGSHKILISTAINTLEVFRITVPTATHRQGEGTDGYGISKQSVLEMHGHRSDVRASCVTSDGLQIATCSAEGMKVWSTKTFNCVVSCPTDYGVSMTYVTGNRYVIVGSKEGKLQVGALHRDRDRDREDDTTIKQSMCCIYHTTATTPMQSNHTLLIVWRVCGCV
jgi:U3 small nucleolar RNA-associated protein 12